MDNLKRCTLCGISKPLSEFSKHRQQKSGLSSWCKECSREKALIFRHSPSGIYQTIKLNANHNSHKPITITRDEFIEWYNSQDKKCVYCDIEESNLQKINDSMNNTAWRLTVDCIDNNVGYVLDNLVLACRRCNNQKSDLFTFQEWYEIAQKYLKPKWNKRIKDDETL